jgi:adenosine deaminase
VVLLLNTSRSSGGRLFWQQQSGGGSQIRWSWLGSDGDCTDVEPDRIAHGPLAIDDPQLCRELADRAISLDLCPTSNVQAGVVPSLESHPIARLHRSGVPVTLSTDDLTVADVSLSDEYVRAVGRIGLTLPELWAIDRRALDVAFAEPSVLEPLRAEFAAWAAGIPELHAG